MIIGTAGHVDHGKSALVRALTGVDTDTLPEERSRGLTINLGFTFFTLPSGIELGVIDLPGHQDFIKNMIAGAPFIDLALLVTAADEGVMPQTIEHLQILSMLNRAELISVISKVDLVSQERIDEIKKELELLFAEYSISAPQIPFSAVDLSGLPQIKTQIANFVENRKKNEDRRAFRLDIMRSFSIRGYGTVATGIPAAGTVSVGDELTLFPAGERVQIRGIHVYNRQRTSAATGMSAALNFKCDATLKRGMVLSSPVYPATSELLLYFKAVCNIKNSSEFLLLHGTTSTSARARLLFSDSIDPNQSGFMRVRLKKELLLTVGDRMLCLSGNGRAIIGSGRVLSCDPPKRAADCELELFSRALAKLDIDPILTLIWSSREFLVSKELKTGFPKEELANEFARLESRGELVSVGEGLYLVSARAPALATKIERFFSVQQKRVTPEKLLFSISQASYNIDPVAFVATLKPFIELEILGGAVYLKEQLPYTQQELNFLNRVLKILKDAPFGIAYGTLSEKLKLPLGRLYRNLERFLPIGQILDLGGYYISEERYSELKRQMLSVFNLKDEAELSDFRELYPNLGRHYLIAILEQLDREGVTLRRGGVRVKKE